MLNSIIAISVGASAGAILRWLLGTSLNTLFPMVPPGTLVANFIGGYCIGIALAVFAHYPDISPEWRLLVVTGFLGGLTTFSTFCAEVATLIQQRSLWWAVTAVLLHVMGSLLMTFLGMATVTLIKRI